VPNRKKLNLGDETGLEPRPSQGSGVPAGGDLKEQNLHKQNLPSRKNSHRHREGSDPGVYEDWLREYTAGEGE
jgi:hypothetical protein